MVCANKVKLTKIALSQKTRMTRNGTGIEPPVCANNCSRICAPFRESLNGTSLQRTLGIIFRRQAFQFVLEYQRLGARLEPNRPAGRNLFLMSDAIGKRPNALPQQVADRSCFRTIL